MKARQWLLSLLFMANVVASACLLLAYLAPSISPVIWVTPALVAMAYIPVALLNIGFIILWSFLRDWRMLLSLTLMLMGLGQHGKHFQANSPATVQGDLKVLSYNVRLFDLYNWSENKHTRDQILDFLIQQNADVVCLQEFFNSSDKQHFNTLDTLFRSLGNFEVHTAYTAIIYRGFNQFGIATFSRYPIVNKGEIRFPSGTHNIAIFTDILKGGDTIRVYNAHLASIHLSGLETDISHQLESDDEEGQIQVAKSVIQLLKDGFRRRAQQAERLSRHMSKSPYPKLLCGDLNDTPGSYTYGQLSREMDDAFKESGFGLGNTYRGFFPSFRIDAILFDPTFDCVAYQSPKVTYSDHFPIVAEFKLSTSTE